MNNDLISRSAQHKHLLGPCVAKYPSSFTMGLLAAARELDAAPAVDAVPVVRCGECSKRYTLQCALCVGQYAEDDESVKMVFVTKPDDFWCAYGEKTQS